MTDDVVLLRTPIAEAAEKLSVVVAGAGQVPAGNDATFLRNQMLGVISRLPGFRNGEWCDVVLTTNAAYSAKDGERVILDDCDPVVTIPTIYIDECGRKRIPDDLSRVHVIGDGYYLFSTSLGAWNKTDNLTESAPFPFGSEDQPGIVALTVMVCASAYGAEVDALTLADAQVFTKSWNARVYREVVVPADLGLLRLSDTGQRGWYL